MTKEIKIALLMAASLFIEMLDSTIVTTALPQMARDFHVSVTLISLTISLYIITLAVFIPISGWLGNQYGKRRIWLIALTVFTLSSLGCALSTHLLELLAMRVIQGISAALMTPTARLIVLEKVEPSRLLTMTNYLIWPALVAPAIAPILGGAIITYWSWHFIFLINLPIGLVIIWLGFKLVPKDQPDRSRAFDWAGFFEMAGAIFLLLAGFQLAAEDGNQNRSLGLLAALIGAALLWQTIRHLRHSDHPLIALKSMKVTSFRIGQTGGSLLWLSVGALPYLLTIYLQTIFGWTAVRAGFYVSFIFLGNVVAKLFSTALIRRYTYRGTLLLSFVMVAVTSFILAFATPQWSWGIELLAFISGLGRSFGLTGYNAMGYAEIEPKDRSDANTLNAVVSTLAQGIGISFIATLVQILDLYLPTTSAYQWGFVILGALMIVPFIEVSRVPKNIGMNAA